MDFLGTMELGMLALIVAVLVVGASALLGWMIFSMGRSRRKSGRRRPKAGPPSAPGAPPPATAGEVAEGPEETEVAPPLRDQLATLSQVGRRASASPVEVLRLLRDRVTGALIVEVEEEKYRKLSEIKDGRVGRQVLQAAADMVRFTEVLQTRQPPPLAPLTLALKVAPSLERESPVPRTPAPPAVEKEFLRSLSQQEQTEEEEESPKISLSPIEFFRRGFAARRAARLQSATPAPRSFVKEIEEILQRFIRTYPSFIGKEVHVGTGPGGGIRIRVENEFYDTPDDIPDPEIRGITKAAIQEWEKS